MFCTRCGTANPDENLFCLNCNSELKRPTTPQRPPQTQRQGGEYRRPGFSDPVSDPYSNPDPNPIPIPTPPPQALEPPYPGYRASYSPPPQVAASASGRAVASMILSLVAIVTCGPLLSIPGWILGKQELDAIKAGQAPHAGETFAKIGYYGGIVVTVLSCLWIVPFAFYWLTIGTIGVN